jgi:hypothetical protein
VRPERKRPGGSIGVAIAYYGIVGLIGAALAAWFVFSLVTDLLSGNCEIGAPGAFLCDHSLQDFIAPAIAFVVGIALLPTARRLRRVPPRLGPLVGVGAVVGVAVALLPIVLVPADFSGSFNIFGSMVPTIVLALPFVGLLLLALASAVIVWRLVASQGRTST